MHKVPVIIVVVQVGGAVEIYVATVEALRKKEREGQNRMKLSLRQKTNGAFLTFTPLSPQPATYPWKANVLFCRFCFGMSPNFGRNSRF